MVKRKSKTLTNLERKKLDFIYGQVYKKNELKKLGSTGYEAFRVSPRTTIKFGKEYKRIYGATVEPDYQRPTGKKNKYGNPTKFGAKVTWYPHAYTTSKVKGGTRLLGSLKGYPVDQKEARRKLLLKPRKKTTTKRRKK